MADSSAQGPRGRAEPPEAVRDLARRRAAARAARDFGTADSLRDELGAAGWLVQDGPGGAYELAARPPYDVLASLDELPDRAGERATQPVTVALLVEGWPADARRCVDALLQHAPDDLSLSILESGDVDGAGLAVRDLAAADPGRIEEWHIAGQVGWGAAQRALLRASPAEIHVIMDVSSVLDGDAITPLIRALDEPGVVGAGWRGANVDLGDAWRAVRDAGPGEVDVLFGYLIAVRRDTALAVGGPDPRARYYRNADLEFSLALRAAGGRLVVPAAEMPCHQERHHGYHDVDPDYRDRESRRNYDRLLRRFRGRTDILAPRR